MKTIAELSVQAILTFDTAGQDMVNARVLVPVRATVGDYMDVEVDVLEQILAQVDPASQAFYPELVKISLCYTRPLRAMDPGAERVFEYLIRDGAKYYFQPDQRGGVEKALMARLPALARSTPAFA